MNLNDYTTQELINHQRQMPTAARAAELESRGVTLWHHSLQRGI